MAGHSKWANIQHRKGKQDAARGKVFTKLVRELNVATRVGGADPDGNPRLRLAIDKAVAASMPKDNIERAIKKASGDLDGFSYEELRYEGYAPGGVAVIVDCMTDNKNRTVADVRHAFSKFGGNLGTDGSVAYQFQKIGVLCFAPGVDEEKVMDVALEAGADDIRSFDEDNSVEVITTPEEFDAVCAAMVAAGVKPDEAEVTMRAENDIALEGEQAQSVAKFLDWLEEMDDVQNVYSNADLGADAYV